MIERKVTFNAETAAPSPRYLAAGMAGDSNSRLIRFDVPALTPDQMVFVKIESGGVSDKVRLYADDEGLYCWSISENVLKVFGDGGQAQVEVSDPNDPLDIRWQSGIIAMSIGASVDVDATISKESATLLKQIEKEMQRVEQATQNSEQVARESAQSAAEDARSAAESRNAAAKSERAAGISEVNAGASSTAALVAAQDITYKYEEIISGLQSGLSASEKAALLTLLGEAVYKSGNVSKTYEVLKKLWNGSELPEPEEVEVELVVLSLATIEMKEGGTAALSAVVYPADATDKSVTWSVSPEGIVSVAGGVITALHAENCVVTATAGGKSASCAVNVEAAVVAVESVTLSQNAITLTEGDSATLTAAVKPDNATDKNVTWAIAPSGIATVIGGVIVAESAGKCTVIATAGGVSASCAVSVEAAVIKVTDVILNQDTMCVKNSGLYNLPNATAAPSNATDKTITWEVSNTSVLNLRATDFMPKATGISTLIAKSGDAKAECLVCVRSAAAIYCLPKWRRFVTSQEPVLILSEYGNKLRKPDTDPHSMTILMEVEASNELAYENGEAPCLIELANYGQTKGLHVYVASNGQTIAHWNGTDHVLADSIDKLRQRHRYAIQIKTGTRTMRMATKSGISEWFTGPTPQVEGESVIFLFGSGHKDGVAGVSRYFDGTFYKCMVFDELFIDAELNEFLQGDTE